MGKNQKDIQGLGLAMLNRVAGSKVVQALGLQRPAEEALYQGARVGFKAAGMANRQFKRVKTLVVPSRMHAPTGADLFDLTMTEEQSMMVDSVRRFAEGLLAPARADAEAHGEVSDEVWSGAFELGLGLMAVPEELGGAGAERSAVTSALVAEALAYGDMGQAAAIMAPLGVANVLASYGSADQQARYLPAFAEDDPPDAALAVLEPRVAFSPDRLETRGRKAGDRWQLSGSKTLVPLGRFADLLIVAADLEGLGPRLVLLETATPGVVLDADQTMGLKAASPGRIALVDALVGADAIVGDAEAFRDVLHLARLAWCALAVGAAQASLDYVGGYVNERHAFGEPVSHRQAVAFTVADMAIELEAMRLSVWRAASRRDLGLPFHREAALAHRLCIDKAMLIGSHGVQMLGGHGFTCEHPVERWYRDLRAVGVMEGGLSL